jgi:NitT/TauT family transport system substrate-binding protein
MTRKFKQNIFLTLTAVVMVLSGVLSACAPQKVTGPKETSKIRIAALPIIDALPFYVAQKQGLYAKYNIQVEFVPVGSAAERDQLIAAGEADGMINDLVSVALYNKQDIRIQTVRFARVASSDTAMYRILANKDNGLLYSGDLKGVPIGMSQGTVIDYVTSRLLEREGLKPEEIKSVAVPKINDRMALLASGELEVATLPEPFGTMAMEQGAMLIVDDSKYPEYGNSVISFRKAYIDENPDAVRGFLAAFDEASALINKNGNDFRPLLDEFKMVPTALTGTYPIPSFPKATIPSQAQWKDVVDWAKSRKMITKDLTYADSITDSYLK